MVSSLRGVMDWAFVELFKAPNPIMINRQKMPRLCLIKIIQSHFVWQKVRIGTNFYLDINYHRTLAGCQFETAFRFKITEPAKNKILHKFK